MEGGPGLERFRVGKIADMFVVPNFLSEDEQVKLLERINAGQWVTLPTTGRRLQQHGGQPEAKGMLSVPLPDWLQLLAKRLHTGGLVSALPNHVLINEYTPGQGILPHTDGPLYTPNFAIISLESALLLDFYRKLDDEQQEALEDRRVCSVWLEPGSLLLISKDAYLEHLHGIRFLEEDVLDDKVLNCPPNLKGTSHPRALRTSLTIRNVKKTISVSKLFGKK